MNEEADRQHVPTYGEHILMGNSFISPNRTSYLRNGRVGGELKVIEIAVEGWR